MSNEINELLAHTPGTKLSREEYINIKNRLLGYLDLLVNDVDDSIFRVVHDNKYESYTNFADIMKRIASDIKNEEIFIYVEQENKYMVFNDCEEFSQFISRIYPYDFEHIQLNAQRHAEGKPRYVPDFIKYQIITTDRKQKLVLAYDTADEAIKTEIVEQAKEYFKVDSSLYFNPKWNLNQLMVDIIMDCYSDNDEYCINFLNHLERYKKGYGGGLSVPPKYRNSVLNKDYIMALVAHKDISSTTHIHRSLPTSNIVININGNNNNVTVNVNNTTNNVKNAPNLRERLTIKFVTENPPGDRECIKIYAKKYKEFCQKNNMEPIRLSKIMDMLGYDQKHSGRLYYWIKKE
jgi:hypothetical protein